MQPTDFNNIVELAQNRALEHPDRDCVIFLEDGENNAVKISYLENDHAARTVAVSLQRLGITKGERVLIILPNGLEFVKIFYGCLYAGILAVPLAEPAGTQNLEAYLETFLPTLSVSKPNLLIGNASLVDFLRNHLPTELEKSFSKLKIASDEEILVETSIEYTIPEMKKTDTAYLQFTSGSTGTPKGIMIGHNNLMANLEEARKFMELEEKNGTAIWLPLFHDFGLVAGLMGALYSGGFSVLMTPSHFIRKPLRWLAAISKFNCAHSYVPPFALDLCLRKISDEDLKDLDLSCLISITDGSEPVHYNPTKQFIDRFTFCGLKKDVIRPGFGMAEIVIMFSGCQEGLKGLCVDRKLLETNGVVKIASENSPETEKKILVNLGPPMDNHEIVIKDLQNKPLPEGSVGELMVSGPSVAQGYFENIKATEEIFRQKINGKEQFFLATGDSALLWNGDLFFTGRIKDIIIIRGRNFYPQDIELALSKIEELRPGCLIAFSAGEENGSEHLSVGVEVRSDLLENMEVFQKYILSSIDQKIIEIVMNNFQILPQERLFLEPGTISKTSSGKVKHQLNKKKFKKENFPGLIKRIRNSEDSNDQLYDDKFSSIKDELITIFKNVVNFTPDLDQPILDCGADSVVIVEFVDQIEKKYSMNLDIQENTTLRDLLQLIIH